MSVTEPGFELGAVWFHGQDVSTLPAHRALSCSLPSLWWWPGRDWPSSFLPWAPALTACARVRSGWPRGLRGVCGDDGPEAEGGDRTHAGCAGAAHRLPRGVERPDWGEGWLWGGILTGPGPGRGGAGTLSLWKLRALQLVGVGPEKGGRGFGSLPARGSTERLPGAGAPPSAWEEEEEEGLDG